MKKNKTISIGLKKATLKILSTALGGGKLPRKRLPRKAPPTNGCDISVQDPYYCQL